METIININDMQRVRCYRDEYPYKIWDILGDGTDVYFISPDYRHHNTGSALDDELNELVNAVTDYWQQTGFIGYKDALIPALEKFFTRRGYDFLEVTLKGYSYEFAWAVMFKPKTDPYELKGCLPALDAWFKGDVFNLSFETLETWQNIATGETRQTWEVSEVIGGWVFDDCFNEDEIRQAALEHYGYNIATIKAAANV